MRSARGPLRTRRYSQLRRHPILMGASRRRQRACKASGRRPSRRRREAAPLMAQPRRAAMLAAYDDMPPRNTLVPATRVSAPAATHCRAVSGVIPPSTSSAIERPDFAMRFAALSIFFDWLGMKDCPPNPGFTVMIRTRSTRSRTLSSASTGVPGLSTTPGRFPRARMCCSVR